MSKNIKIAKAERTDIWKESLAKAASVPDANYRHVDCFEANKKKAHEFGKPFKTTYNNNPSPDRYQPDITKNLMATSSNQKISRAERTDIWKESLAAAASVPDANYRHVDCFEANKNKAYEFGKPYETKYNQNPSPDKYMPDQSKSSLNKAAHPKIGTESRPDIWAKEVAHAKATPEVYPSKDTFEINKSKAAMIGLPRKEEKNNNPAPGQYEPVVSNSFSQSGSKKNMAFSRDPRRDPFEEDIKRSKEMPSNLYAQEQGTISATKKSFTIGTGFTHSYNQNPGPGQYEHS
jgi:hypothetical protein